MGRWWLISTLPSLWLEGGEEGTSQEQGSGRVLQTLGVSGSHAECSLSRPGRTHWCGSVFLWGREVRGQGRVLAKESHHRALL